LSPANAPLTPERDDAPVPHGGADVLRMPGVPDSVETQAGPSIGAEPAAKVTLYHFPTSLSSQEVRLALTEKGVAWDSKIVNIGPAHEHFAPWYAKINPRLVVPTLEVDGTIVTNSTDICLYIDASFDGPPLMPADPEARAEALRWMQREDQLPMRELGYARTKGITRWLQRYGLEQRRKKLEKLRKRNPELDDIYTAKLADLAILQKTSNDRVAMAELVDQVEGLFDELELALADRPWLAGSDYSLADLVWTAVIVKLEHIGFARSLSAHRHPRVHEWYTRLRERPSWGAMIRRLTPWEVARFYGPAAIKAFLIFWVLKWVLVGGGVWLIRWLIAG